jgi:hypothetical protein
MARIMSDNDGFTVGISYDPQHLPKGHAGQAQVTFYEYGAIFWVDGVETETEAQALAMATLIQMARKGSARTLASAKPGEKVKL